MINRFILLFLAALSIGCSDDFNNGGNPPGINSKNIVFAADFEEYSHKSKTSELIGTALVVDTGVVYYRLSPHAKWHKQENMSKDQLDNYQAIVEQPDKLKPFVSKDDPRHFRFDMNNYHVNFPEDINDLYRALLTFESKK